MSKHLFILFKILLVLATVNIIKTHSSGSNEIFIDMEASGHSINDPDVIEGAENAVNLKTFSQSINNFESKLLEVSNVLYKNQQDVKNLRNLEITVKNIESLLQTMAIVLEKNQKEVQKLNEIMDAKGGNNKKHSLEAPADQCSGNSLAKQYNGIKVPSNVLELQCSNQLPESCMEIKDCYASIFKIAMANGSRQDSVACDLHTEDGGWTVIQRRQDGTVNFNRNWTSYLEGFGDLNGNFFIGLETLYYLTTQKETQELYIIMRDFEGVERHARYSSFSIGPPDQGFVLSIGGYSGDAGDSLGYNGGSKFATSHDNYSHDRPHKGGWWYREGGESNLNGDYLMGKTHLESGIVWESFRGKHYSLKFVQMMIRPSFA
ncbi:angiopoietin-related protein 2 [Musca domestica]|nr:angiopoietin-related protein 2 [Musca domestica]